jgi:cyclophilin family peptidyl-prolyl cis-trans isomerase
LINIKVNGSSRIMVNRTHITTQFGDIELEFYSDVAPKTVENFKKLAENRFYDGLIFHRIVPGFVIQGGDPHTRDTNDRGRWGTGGPGWTIKAEFNKNKHSRGAISMARSQDPDSAGSQFFIVLQDSYFLDGQYTVFGRVISGMDIVDKISSLKTDSKDAPIDPDQARMITVTVRD